MTRILRHFLNALLLGGGIAATAMAEAPPEHYEFTPDQAVGGAHLTLPDGQKAAALDKSCAVAPGETGPALTWKTSPQMSSAGWYIVTIQTATAAAPAPGEDRDAMALVFQTEKQRLAVSLRDLPWTGSPGAPRFRVLLHADHPVTAIRLAATGEAWKKGTLRPIAGIQADVVRTPPPDEQAVVLAGLMVSPGETVVLPTAFLANPPAGLWQMRGIWAQGGTAVFTQADGRAVSVPFAAARQNQPVFSNIHFSTPPVRLTLSTGTQTAPAAVTLLHLRSGTAEAFPAGTDCLPTREPGKTEPFTLVLKGVPADTAALPALPLLPHGKKTAVLATWDVQGMGDLQAAEILARLGYRPTLFVRKPFDAMKKALANYDAQGGEIGSLHPGYPAFSRFAPPELLRQCQGQRAELEKFLRHPVISFSYFEGYTPIYDEGGDAIARAVREAGFWSARGTGAALVTVETAGDPLTLKTGAWAANADGLDRLWAETRAKDGGIFHFQGHQCMQIGWKDTPWKLFEATAAKFAGVPDAWYATQGELALWLWLHGQVKIAETARRGNERAYTITRPWLHPWLAARAPLTLTVPDGATAAVWQGREIPVTGNYVELPWPEEQTPPAP